MRKRENRANDEKKQRYKSGEETLEKRIYDKLLESSTWFKDKEREKKEKIELVRGEESPDIENREFNEKNKSWKGWRISKRRREKKILRNLQGKIMPRKAYLTF